MDTLSELGICNLALGWLGANRITSFDDNLVEAQLCKDNYGPILRALLEVSEWTFAQHRFKPPAESTPPDWGYASQFKIPATVLRIHYVGLSDRKEEDDPAPVWNRASPIGIGDVIECDASVIYCRGTRMVEDVSKLSGLFGQAMAARIAADLAMPLTNSRGMASDMWTLFSNKIVEAERMDSKQGRARVLRAPGMLQARLAGGNTIGPNV